MIDEDIEENKKNLTKIQKLFTMNRSADYPMNYHRRFSRRMKSCSTVVPIPTFDCTDKYPNARIVKIRLVFIHIGKNNFFFFFL